MQDNVAPMPGMGKPNLWNIPEELRDLPQWVVHKAKVPHQVNGLLACVTHPNTWSAFTEVIAAFEGGEFDGTSLVLSAGDPYAGSISIIAVTPATGKIAPWAWQITRAEIERHLANLDCGDSLTPGVPERGWTGNDILALPGICHFAVFFRQGDRR